MAMLRTAPIKATTSEIDLGIAMNDVRVAEGGICAQVMGKVGMEAHREAYCAMITLRDDLSGTKPRKVPWRHLGL